MSYMDNPVSFVPRKITTCNTTTFRCQDAGMLWKEGVNSYTLPALLDPWALWQPSKPLALGHGGAPARGEGTAGPVFPG